MTTHGKSWQCLLFRQIHCVEICVHHLEIEVVIAYWDAFVMLTYNNLYMSHAI